MKKLRLFFALLLGLLSAPFALAQNWQLVWQDEFTNGIGPQ